MVKKTTKTTSKKVKTTDNQKKITWFNAETTKKTSTKNKISKTDLSYIENDKILEKIEKYVNKNREKTSQEIIERKWKRPDKKFQEWDLEVMISRISADSKPNEKAKETSKRILYIIYAIIIIMVLIFMLKYFLAWNIPQNW